MGPIASRGGPLSDCEPGNRTVRARRDLGEPAIMYAGRGNVVEVIPQRSIRVKHHKRAVGVIPRSLHHRVGKHPRPLPGMGALGCLFPPAHSEVGCDSYDQGRGSEVGQSTDGLDLV